MMVSTVMVKVLVMVKALMAVLALLELKAVARLSSGDRERKLDWPLWKMLLLMLLSL
jgi:hypothetical protein